MSGPVDWRSVLAPALVQQLEDEMSRKFAEGWQAYEQTLLARMRAMPTPSGEQRSSPERTPPPSSHDEMGSASRAYPEKRAPRGLWPGLIETEVKSVSPAKLALAETMRRVQAKAPTHKLARSSFNAAVQTLERDGRLRREGRFLVWNADETPPSDTQPQPEAKTPDATPDVPSTSGQEVEAERQHDFGDQDEPRQLAPFSSLVTAAE